jgi:hypothetical protein
MEMKKQIPGDRSGDACLASSEISAPDLMKAVTGERPKSEPMEIPNARKCERTVDD